VDSLNLRDAEVALVRDAVKHAVTLAAAAAALGIEVVETEAPPPAGTPPWFRRELIALALKTADVTMLDTADQDYRGVFANVDEFIHNQLGEYLPPHLQWLPACCDTEKLRSGYERGQVQLWTIGLPDGQVMVFESQGDSRRRAILEAREET
jgi:nitroreductase